MLLNLMQHSVEEKVGNMLVFVESFRWEIKDLSSNYVNVSPLAYLFDRETELT